MTGSGPRSGSLATHSLALFGKRDAGGDYEWLRGRDAIPDPLYGACEHLAQTSNETGVILSLVAVLAQRTFLVRTFRQGIDSAYRPILALEVAAVEGDSPMSAVDWLGLAWGSLQPASQELAGKGGLVSFEIPVPTETDSEPEVLDQVRLGIPVSVTAPVARSLLRRYPDHFLGVVLAPKLKSGSLVSWKPFLAPYLAVNFGRPSLREEEEEALEVLRQRPPSAEEWEWLRNVAPEQVRRALRWALHPDGEPPPLQTAAGKALLPWLACFRRQQASGAGLLRALRADLGAGPLLAAVLEDAFPTLTLLGREAVLAALREEAGSASMEALEELARQGLLADEEIFPLRSWAPAARGSEVLAEHALEILEGWGESRTVARIALQLPILGLPPGIGALSRAAEISRQLSIPLSPEVLRDALSRASSEKDLEAVERIGEASGPEGVRLATIARHGALPEEREIEPADLVLALGARARALPESSLASLLAGLLDRGWTEEARAVLAAEAEGRLPLLSPEARHVARVRLDGGPALEVTDVDRLRSLVWAGLARPEDVIPPAHAETLAVAAELWPQTAPLAGTLRGEGAVPPGNTCPAAWLPAFREAFPPELAQRWLTQLGTLERPAGWSWLCIALGLPDAMARLFGNASLRGNEAQEIRRHLSWVKIFIRVSDAEERLTLLLNLIRARIPEGDDRLAEELAAELLPDMNEELHSLAVYLLSGIGPLPPLASISPELLSRLVPLIPALPLVDALFVSPEPALTRSPALVEAVYLRVRAAAVACPERRYTAAQIGRHAALARRLAELPEWEPVSPDLELLRRAARRAVRLLGLPEPSWEGNGDAEASDPGLEEAAQLEGADE